MFFGYDNISMGNSISGLRSASDPLSSNQTLDENFKAYGNVSKWIAFGSIGRGEAVRLFTEDNLTLKAQKYNTTGETGFSDSATGVAFLGIALNDAVRKNLCMYERNYNC